MLPAAVHTRRTRFGFFTMSTYSIWITTRRLLKTALLHSSPVKTSSRRAMQPTHKGSGTGLSALPTTNDRQGDPSTFQGSFLGCAQNSVSGIIQIIVRIGTLCDGEAAKQSTIFAR